MSEERSPEELREENSRLLAELTATRNRAEAELRRAEALDGQLTRDGAHLHTAQLQQLEAQEQAIATGLSSLEREILGIRERKTNLLSEGKFEEVAELDEQLADAVARRRQHLQAKEHISGVRERAAQTPADPVERWLNERNGTYAPDEMAWIRNHRRYALDQGFQARVIEAHRDWVERQGKERGSPEYYQYIERKGYMRPDPVEERASAVEEEREQEPAPSGLTGGSAAMDERRPQNPQPRAAGPGSMRSAIAASPSRRTADPSSTEARRTIANMSQADRETALAIAPHMAPAEKLAEGEASVLLWWEDQRNSPAGRRILEKWANK